MDTQRPTKKETEERRTLLTSLASLGQAAEDASTAGGQEQARAERAYEDLLQRTAPTALLPALNVLTQPGYGASEGLLTRYRRALALLPLRADDDGVRATLEFVFAVHPSAPTQDLQGGSTGRPPEITPEALQMATRLLARPPAAIAPDTWFSGLASQLLALLDGRDGLALAKVAAYVVGFGILGRRVYGAPGQPGWMALVAPMLRSLDPTSGDVGGNDNDNVNNVIDLRTGVLVRSMDLVGSLRRLQTLILAHPNPGLTRRLLGRVIQPLWALASWWPAPAVATPVHEDVVTPARNLLTVYLRLATGPDHVLPLVQGLLFDGVRSGPRRPFWTYVTDADHMAPGCICIVTASAGDATTEPARLLQTHAPAIRSKAQTLVDLLEAAAADNEDVTDLFFVLVRRWLTPRAKQRTPRNIVLVANTDENQSDDNPLEHVLEGSVLQALMEKCPDKLAARPDQLLQLVAGMLGQTDDDGDDIDDDDTVAVLLSLLNLVVTAPGFRRANVDAAVLETIETALETTASAEHAETAATAKNLLLLLRYRDQIDAATGGGSEVDDGDVARRKRVADDRKTQSLALSYLTAADTPPPVRVEGLSLLQTLVEAGSPVLDVPAVLVLLSAQLEGGDVEDYVAQHTMRVFVAVAKRHPRATARELLVHYEDVAETARGGVDARLRFGEALLQVVQRQGAALAGELAQVIGQTLLTMAGRLPQRPKTAARQARQDARSRDENDDEDDDPIYTIGWGSRAGREDIRIRASALSVLATAIETNIAGFGGPLASAAVDVALHVLTLEGAQQATAILRRAAIVLVLSFVRALDAARAAGRRLGFGLTPQSHADMVRVLQYVAATDGDVLVVEHAHDVLETLESWQVAMLLADAATSESDTTPQLRGALAGLTLDPVHVLDGTSPSSAPGPRIEEVE